MFEYGRHAPHLQTALPGPEAAAMIARDERYTSPSYTRDYPLAVRRGRGAVIEDVDGNLFLDFTAGIAVCSTGHCHPRVVQAITSQASELIHMSGTDFYYGPQSELAQKLATLVPGSSNKRVFFTNSGAESVEAALKLARHHSKRSRVLAYHGAFHGRTLGALSLTASKTVQRAGFGPLLPGVTHVDYPDAYRYPHRVETVNSRLRCVDDIENKFFRHSVPPDEVAAIIVEPIQGEGGYIVPPTDFHRQLKALAEKYGILYVVDEVQSGMGRTGRMFAIEHWGVEPDILCTAKGIASGMPLGAMIARESIMTWPPGSHASTFGGNPISCAAALATIELLEDELIENAEQVGEFLKDRLRDLEKRHILIGDVRGRGLMLAIELVRDRDTKERASHERNALVQACFRRGLLVLGCGENSLRLCPPLVVSESQCERAVAILDEAMGEIDGD